MGCRRGPLLDDRERDRLGELLGLQWGDIDFQGRFIEVRRSLVEGGRIELPKNGRIRRVDLSLLLGETLEKLRVRRPPMEALEARNST